MQLIIGGLDFTQDKNSPAVVTMSRSSGQLSLSCILENKWNQCNFIDKYRGTTNSEHAEHSCN